VQVVVVALEDAVFLEMNLYIEVARRTTIDAWFPFTGEANAIALVDA
jgi:hypothetical protein